jgi:predicted nuclease of predicted toxin-antitoxin system
MYLLIDECCGKSLVRVAESLGHTAQRTTLVTFLGRGASDNEIVEFARRNEAIIVTSNSVDFLALAAAGRDHAGMILLPSVIGQDLGRLFRQILPVVANVFAQRPNMFVAVDANGDVQSFKLP